MLNFTEVASGIIRTNCPFEEKNITLQIILRILENPDVRMQWAQAGLEPALRELQESVPQLYTLAFKALTLLLSYPAESHSSPIAGKINHK